MNIGCQRKIPLATFGDHTPSKNFATAPAKVELGTLHDWLVLVEGIINYRFIFKSGFADLRSCAGSKVVHGIARHDMRTTKYPFLSDPRC